MNTKEKKSVRDALRHIENFIEGFYFINRLESSYYYIIENFCVLERMCA